MNFFDAVWTGYVKKFATFSGRASRSEFWYLNLFFLGGFGFCYFVDKYYLGGYNLQLIFDFVSAIPCFSVAVRRLHDINLRGWWVIYAIVPFLNFVFYYWATKKPVDHENRFGENPLTDHT